jgi:rhodanese-related sulfurtransferase
MRAIHAMVEGDETGNVWHGNCCTDGGSIVWYQGPGNGRRLEMVGKRFFETALIVVGLVLIGLLAAEVFAHCGACGARGKARKDKQFECGTSVSEEKCKPCVVAKKEKCEACSSGKKCEKCVTAKKVVKPQTTCPVMGGKISRKIFVDVKGRRIYACCQGCLPKIKAEPDKYIKKILAKGETPERAPGAHELTTKELKKLLDSGTKVILLDARTGKFDDGRRIPGAKSLSPKARPEEVEKVAGKNKDALIVTYCSNLKCPASSYLFKHLKGLGYTNLHEYPHGIEGWAKAGNKVEKVK